jgi:hypothetical protein
LLLALGLPAFFVRPKPRGWALLFYFFGFLWCFWALSSQQVRYLMPGLALLCLPAAWCALTLARRSRAARCVTGVACGLWFVGVPVYFVALSQDQWPVVSGTMSPGEYLTRSFPGYAAMEYINKTAPPQARVAVYGEPRCFYLNRDYFWADDEHNNLIDYDKIQSGDELINALKKLGVTHVLVDTRPGPTGGAFGVPPRFAPSFNAARLPLLFEANGYQYFALP